MKNQPEGFYTTFEDEEGDVTISDKDFDKVFVNFVGIETICLKYHSFFPSKSKLHKHIKAGWVEEALPPFFAQLSSSIPIVMSKTIDQSLGSGLGFRSWTYVTTSITLTPEHLPPSSSPDSTACIDTGCEVTLVDRNWLLKRLTHQKISTMSIFLKVRGIGASKHKSAEFAALLSYFPGKNNAEQLVYTALNCEIYLVKGL